jgi:uracil-DNA glycosylase
LSNLSEILGPSWAAVLHPLFETADMRHLRDFLKKELLSGAIVYPHKNAIFKAFKLTPLHSARVIILGQDPYHAPGQAEGLAFSVPDGIPIPPSLLNIYKELHSSHGIAPAQSGSLLHWALQGVLLLNTTLTVRANEPLSHQGQGWEYFTDAVITVLAQQESPRCFVLLGKHAQTKRALIERSDKKHLIIQAAHPSPLSAYRGFFGSGIFHQIDTFLDQHHYPKILWAHQDFETQAGLLSTEGFLSN